MAKPDAPQNEPRAPHADPLGDTTFDRTADETTQDDTVQHETVQHATTQDDTTQLEQAVHHDTTGRADSTEGLDTTETTRALAVEDQSASRDLFGNPVRRDDDPTAGVASTGADDRDWPPVLPERPSGPHAPAIVLGLVCLAVAVIIFAQELGDLTVDWGDIGPFGIVVTGAVLVLFGLVGLLTSRRNSRTG